MVLFKSDEENEMKQSMVYFINYIFHFLLQIWKVTNISLNRYSNNPIYVYFVFFSFNYETFASVCYRQFYSSPMSFVSVKNI